MVFVVLLRCFGQVNKISSPQNCAVPPPPRWTKQVFSRNKFFWLRSNSALLTSRQLCLRFSDRNIDARWVCWKDFYQIFGRVSILLPKPDNVIKRTFQTISRLWPQTFCAWSLCTVLSCKHSSSQATNAKETNIYSQFSNWCHKRVYLGLLFQITSEGRQYKKTSKI